MKEIIFLIVIFSAAQFILGDQLPAKHENMRERRNVYKQKAPKKIEPVVTYPDPTESYANQPEDYVQLDDQAIIYEPSFQPKFQTATYQGPNYNFYNFPTYPDFSPYNSQLTSQYNIYNSYSRKDMTYEQFCTDACAIRSNGGYKQVFFSPKTINYPTNYGLSQDLDDMNCYCFCPVPSDQDPDYKLCNSYGDSHNSCENFCLGHLPIKPVNIVGSNITYNGGSCIEGSGCNCHCKIYAIPLQ